MKKTLLFLGMIAVSAVTSGVTVWAVDRSHTDKIEYIEREVRTLRPTKPINIPI